MLGQLGTAVVGLALLTAARADAAEPHVWRYAGRIVDDEAKERPANLELREIGRRTIGERTVVDLAVYKKGKLVTGAVEEALGIPQAPFPTLSTYFSIVVGKDGKGAYVAIFAGDAPAEQIDKADDEWGRFRATKRPHPGAKAPLERAFRYAATIEKRPSVCEAYEHPSPDTGDFYETERCWAPGIGLTRLRFVSVWGGYSFDLVSSPATPAFDDQLGAKPRR